MEENTNKIEKVEIDKYYDQYTEASMQKIIIQKIINENNDKLEIGTPSKGGSIRVSGDFNKPEEFKMKIDNALDVREYANKKISIN